MKIPPLKSGLYSRCGHPAFAAVVPNGAPACCGTDGGYSHIARDRSQDAKEFGDGGTWQGVRNCGDSC